MMHWPRLFPQYLCSITQGVTNWGGGGSALLLLLLSLLRTLLSKLLRRSHLEEWESCGDVDAGRLAGETGPCTPWTVNPTLMMQEARLLTCREVSDNARRRMVLRR